MVAPLVIGAALGLAKGIMDQEKEKKQRAEEATIARWSPWSGMKPGPVQQADVLGSTLQGGLAGMMYGQANPEAAGAAGSLGAAGGPGTVGGMQGAVPPMGGSAPYAGTPAGAAMNQGQFPQYYQQNYTQPWAMMPRQG